MSRLAVVLFNLGGPDSLNAVQPFLFNLFNDPAIIGVPQPLRWMLAQFISRRRAPTASKIYEEIGGASPLLPNTEAQAAALARDLDGRGVAETVQCFIAMRYWHPMTAETVEAVKGQPAPETPTARHLAPHVGRTPPARTPAPPPPGTVIVPASIPDPVLPERLRTPPAATSNVALPRETQTTAPVPDDRSASDPDESAREEQS